MEDRNKDYDSINSPISEAIAALDRLADQWSEVMCELAGLSDEQREAAFARSSWSDEIKTLLLEDVVAFEKAEAEANDDTHDAQDHATKEEYDNCPICQR